MTVHNIMLGVFFAFNWLYSNTLRALNDVMDENAVIEIKEFVFAIILFMLPLYCMKYKKV